MLPEKKDPEKECKKTAKPEPGIRLTERDNSDFSRDYCRKGTAEDCRTLWQPKPTAS